MKKKNKNMRTNCIHFSCVLFMQESRSLGTEVEIPLFQTTNYKAFHKNEFF